MHPVCHSSCDHSRAGFSRRDFLRLAATATVAATSPALRAQTPAAPPPGRGPGSAGAPTHPLIDIHVHQLPDSLRGQARGGGKAGSAARTEAQFLAHQKAINAVGAVILGGNDHDYAFIRENPGRYVRFASAGQAAGDRAAAIERALKGGARGIGEHRWEGDIPFTWAILDMARDYDVPILFHFEESQYPAAVYAQFHRVIEKYPTVKFIGHAIDWWGAIDKDYDRQGGNYPRGRVNPGGLTDLWLARYPNLHCDLSAQSGNTALLRDPAFAKDFVTRHQDKILFGSDCPCTNGGMPTCWAGIKLVALNFLQLSDEVKRKIYLTNAQKLFKLQLG